MHLFYTPDIATCQELPEEEAAHAIKVLRLQAGDKLTLTDGKGYFYQATIQHTAGRKCSVTVDSATLQPPLWSGHLHIAVAPTKNMDRLEWFAEKATEIGLDELSLLNCQHSERRVVKEERIRKILISAMKQSLKARLPKLNSMMTFEQFVNMPIQGQKFIAHCYPEKKKMLNQEIKQGENATVLIGPEGDFSEEEVRMAMERGFVPISLGPSRLRTETAALVACHLLNLHNQENVY